MKRIHSILFGRFFLSMISILSVTLLFALTVHFYDANRLSSNLINDICQDKTGYIWIATGYGLNKFDGAHYTNYFNDPNDSTSLSSNTVKNVLLDRKGNLWILTSNAVQRYNRDDDSFVKVKVPDQEKSSICALKQDTHGNLYVLSAKSGLYKIDSNKMVIIPVTVVNKKIVGPKFTKLYVDMKQRFWIFTENGHLILCSYKGEQRVYFADIKEEAGKLDYENKLIGMVEYKDILYLISHREIYKYNERSLKFEKGFTPPFSLNGVYKDRNGNLYASSNGNGLFELQMEKGKINSIYKNLTNGVDLSMQKISAFFKDADNNIWLGCYQKGMFCINDKVRPFSYLSLGENNFLTALFADSKGHVYVGIEKSGLQEITPDGHFVNQYFPGISVNTVCENKDGSLWVGTDNKGAFLFNPSTKSEMWLDSLAGLRIKAFSKDKNDNIYIAAFNKGLYSYESKSKKQRKLCGGQMKLHNRYILTLMSDSKNRIWIGHYYGFDVYDANRDKLLDIPMDSVLRKATTFSLVESQNRYVWVGTNNGLFRFDEKKSSWKHYTTEDGLPNECICGIVDSRDGNLWISTFKGLSKMNIEKETFVNYYNGNGLEFSNYSRGVYCRSKYGMIGFGNDNGLTYFMPQNVENRTFISNIVLTGLMVSGKRMNKTCYSGGKKIMDCAVEQTNVLRLSYVDNTFTLLFSTMDYRDVENVCYQYRFEDEKDNVWHSTEAGASEVTLSHLSWGKHNLLVRACDNGESSVTKMITIYILPPWYASWWAYLIYLLIACSLLYLAWKNFMQKRLSEENEAKLNLFVDFSHELRSPLTLIKNPLDVLLKKDFDTETAKALSNMKRNTDRLLRVVNQILSIRKIDNGQMQLHYAETNLVDFIRNQCGNFEYQANKDGVSLLFNCQEDNLVAWIDREQFDKIITNLLSNAFKYVKSGGEIIVSLSRSTVESKKETIILSVKDSGPGIDENQINMIFERFYQTSTQQTNGHIGFGIGLNLARKLVTLHGGTIEAHNRQDIHGAEFLITLPTGKSHLPIKNIVNKEYFESMDKTTDMQMETIDNENYKSARKRTSNRIVVVDDDEEILKYINDELGKLYYVSTYTNSSLALSKIIEELPELVISDIKMPEMDGYTLTKRLKGNTKTSHIPVILLTTEIETASKVKGFEHGADAYVDKPFDMEELKARISALIANRKRMKGKYSGSQEQQGVVNKIELKGINADLMDKVMKVLNERLTDENFNVEALAEEVGLSRVQLHRRIKEYTGITVGEFIRNFRLQQAAQMLEKGDVTVSQVSYAIGLSNPTHFSIAFKNFYGISPTEYMKEHAQNESDDA